ncbi:hypothetical protein KVT40_003739 [Elsinoe batatas]|uniref:Uncharacterized protein n=1 Tax=Elsinoe batatas TaxID=2601811 RepID=A0A8K0L0Y4_9PEZI|nr:hypothetical protein KVT40_003739 [Elsinoe batatas]
MAPTRADKRPHLVRTDRATKSVSTLQDKVTGRIIKKRATTKHVIHTFEKQAVRQIKRPAGRGQPTKLNNTASPSSAATYPIWLSSLKHPLNDFSDNGHHRHENLGLFEGRERARRESVNTTESAVKTARFADLHERVMVWASRVENEPIPPKFSTGRKGGPTQAAQIGQDIRSQDTRGQDIRVRTRRTTAALDSQEDIPTPSSPVLHERYTGTANRRRSARLISQPSSPGLHERDTGTVNRRRSARLIEREEAGKKSKKRHRRKTT